MRPRNLLLATIVAAVASTLVPAAAAAPSTTRVGGTVQYTIADGRLRFARQVAVELRDADGSASGRLIGAGTTDDFGIFSFTVSTRRPDGTARRPFVRALSRTSGATVHAPGTNTPYAVALTPQTATGATQTRRLVARTTDAGGSSFDVVDALVTGIAYGRRLAGTVPSLSVAFPDTVTDSDDQRMRVGLQDRFDWDVVLHEYGHAVAISTGLDTSPGGTHTFGQNLAEPPRSKSAGLRLAWGEGIATWFSLSAQDVLGASSLDIPGVADDVYDDTEDRDVHVPIGTDGGIASAGEDDELSIARTLWHFRVDARTRIADTAMFSALRAAHATTLSTAVPALLRAGDAAPFGGTGSASQVAHSNDFACVLGRQDVAPVITAPAEGAVSATVPPTFTWRADGAGPSHQANRFVLQVWSPDWSAPRLTSTTLTATTFTPTAAQWKNAVHTDDSAVHVVVRGTGLDAPRTGPYAGCALDLSPGGAMTATPLGTSLHPPALTPACAGQASPFDSMFSVTASGLTPDAVYDLVLHAADGGVADRVLTHATTTAAGVLLNTTAIVPGVPSGRTWKAVARPRHAGDATASVERPISGYTCTRGDPDHPHVLTWGGAGAVPGTAVSESDGSTTLSTVTADGTGTWSGSHPLSCSGTKTLLVRFTDLDGPAMISIATTCP